MLVVDDGSPDGTGDIVKSVAAELPDVHLIARPGKAGLGSAYRTGFVWGMENGYDVLIEMDADFSHDPGALPALVQPLREGYDVAIGSRYVKGGSVPNWARHRHLLSAGGQPLRLDRARPPGVRLDRRLPRLLGRHVAQARSRPDPGRGLRVPDRDDLPGQAARGQDQRGADHVRRSGGRRVENVISHRVRSTRPRDLVGTGPRRPRLPAPGPTRSQPTTGSGERVRST